MRQLYKLSDSSLGSYRVITASGTVLALDLIPPARTLTRLPYEHPPKAEFDVPDPVRGWDRSLRRDQQPIRLLQVARLEVGERGGFWLDLLENGVLTYRDTTPVISITRLKDN